MKYIRILKKYVGLLPALLATAAVCCPVRNSGRRDEIAQYSDNDYDKGWRSLFVPVPPWMTIVSIGSSNIVVSWSPTTPGWVQQEVINLETNWLDSASGSMNPVIIPATNAAVFYRLRQE